MSRFITLGKIDGSGFNEDTGLPVESTVPCLINVNSIRCLYARRDNKPGTRITFSDGGGFAVAETPDAIAALVAGGDVAAPLSSQQ